MNQRPTVLLLKEFEASVPPGSKHRGKKCESIRRGQLPVRFLRLEGEAMRESVKLSFPRNVWLGPGAVHGLAHPVGLLYGLPHGVVCALLLPHVLALNAAAVPHKYSRLGEAMGCDPVQKVRELLEVLDLPTALGPYPDPGWERRIMDDALPSGSARANPVPVDETYVREVLRGVCSGCAGG